MPLQNRVDPYGRLHAVAARRTLMGNRGVLHDASNRIVASWRTKRWITCSLDFRGRRRSVFAPKRYSELFFLDEATALSAGHRPCAECRRSRYEEFRAAWASGRGGVPAPLAGADDIDRVLHAERVASGAPVAARDAPLGSLPPGVMVEHRGRPCLHWRGALLPWSFSGYGPPLAASPRERVTLLTPGSIVEAIRAGFVPAVHPSATP